METPSQLPSYSISSSCFCSAEQSLQSPHTVELSRNFTEDQNDSRNYFETRVASEHHVMHVTALRENDNDNDRCMISSRTPGLQMKCHSLPTTVDVNCDNVNTSDRRNRDKICLAHSYLSWPWQRGQQQQECNPYLEAFVMSQSKAESSMGIGNTTTSSNSDANARNTQSSEAANLSVSEPRRDAALGTSVSVVTTTTSEGPSSKAGVSGMSSLLLEQDSKQSTERVHDAKEYQITLEGYIPLLENGTSSDSRDPVGKRPAISFQKVSQTIPISYSPSSIELCQVVSSFSSSSIGPKNAADDYRDSSCEIILFVLLFVVNGNETKIYTLSANDGAMTERRNDSDEKPWFHIEQASVVQSNGNVSSDQGSNMNHLTSSNHDSLRSLLFHSAAATTEPIESIFILQSPITAMNTFQMTGSVQREQSLFGLSMACQDGTIRIVTFHLEAKSEIGNNKGTFPFQLVIDKISQYTVDGPITCLLFQPRRVGDNTRMVLHAGSTCGFACTLVQSSDDPTHFDAPCLIVDGLWNCQLDDDDAVLCVSEFDYGGVESSKVVAIGTYSGRVLLFASVDGCEYNSSDEIPSSATDASGAADGSSKYNTSPEYYCFWYCTLPYPVHRIQVHSLPTHGFLPDMIVFTRRSIHLFQCNLDIIADSTLERIDRILYKVRGRMEVETSTLL